MVLYSVLRELAEDEGADFFCVADLSPAHDAILGQGGACGMCLYICPYGKKFEK